MNIIAPLASTLLMTASVALAQTLDAVQQCPAGDATCIRDFMAGPGAANLSETIAAYTLSPGTRWASDSCQHIPCRTVSSGAPEPPPFDAKDFQRELADARDGNKNTVVDLGDNRYGIVDARGGVTVCGRGQCDAKPRPAGDFPDLADRIQAATSINAGAKSLNKDNSDDRASNPGGPGPVSLAAEQPPLAPNEPARLGAEFADEQSAIAAGAGSYDASFAASGNGETSAPTGGDGVNKVAVVADTSRIQLTYRPLQKLEETIVKTASAVHGPNDVFETGSGRNANDGGHQPRGTRSSANSR